MASSYFFETFLRRRRIQNAATRITSRMNAAPPMIPPICGFVRPPFVDVFPLVASAFGTAVAVGVSLGTADVFAGIDGEAGVDAVTNVEAIVWVCE